MPLQATSGAASYDAFGGGVPAGPPIYIEDVFSTYLYTGTGASLTITNNIDLSTKGGMVWFKNRNGTFDHSIFDTARGVTKSLRPNETVAEATETDGLTAFNANGFTIGNWSRVNSSTSTTYASWTWRKQPKFFDVVTYTGTGSNRTIAHALGSVPACIMVKRTDTTGDWQVYHRSLANTEYLVLNSTAAAATGATRWNSTTPTSSVFSLGTDATVNASGGTYVAYIFAHDAGGFGLTGTDNVISCGSFTTDGSGNATVNLGYEPQWLLLKNSSESGQNWSILDNMRGWTAGGGANLLDPNTSAAEVAYPSPTYDYWQLTSTGFKAAFTSGNANKTYIYIAIRRGPMKVPTTGTSVFSPNISSGATGTAITTNFPVDLQLYKQRNAVNFSLDVDRLRGVNTTTTANATPWLDTVASAAEVTNTGVSRNWGSTGFEVPSGAGSASYIYYSFGRSPSFFDEVCYTGTGTSTAVSHNLAAVPELMIVKARSTSGKWTVYNAPRGNTAYMFLEETTASQTDVAYWSNTTPTASNFTVNALNNVNGSGITYVAYLFATCAGVSKVGSYTGNGSTQTIDCGFGAGGARFVLIKRTDSTGGWYVYDTARGMTVLTDPYLFFNDYAAEVATLGSVTTVSTGFAVNATVLAAINTNAASYIFLAIA
jgi:hypothetical protein